MEMLITVFWIFAKLSLFSFGGGFVMVPAAIAEIEANQWATASELTNSVAIATMAPGPVGVNLAVGLGYQVGGLPGASAAFLGITLPTTILVVFIALFFFKIYKHPLVSAAFYGLRPTITGIILYAAISLALKNGILFAANDRMLDSGINVIFNGW
ncbi:MAG: chromate transport protein ChrA, partial [Sporomusa sp.]|nr:chromate transport protein ChrA [Sporomusa sp.]